MASSSHNVPVEASPSSVLWVGLGCQKGASKSLIEQAIRDVFRACALQEDKIAGLATIDTKVDEAGLIEFCHDRNLPLFFYPANVLRSVAVPNPLRAIESAVGTPSVAEAAAILACYQKVMEQRGNGEEQETFNACTRLDFAPGTLDPTVSFPLPTTLLHIPKQRYRSAETPGTVTIAVARSLPPGEKLSG